MACIYIINGKQFSEIDQSAIDELIKANLLEPNSAKTIAMAYQIAKEDNTNPDFTDKIDAILKNSPQQNEKQNNQNTNEANGEVVLDRVSKTGNESEVGQDSQQLRQKIADLRAAEQAEYDAMSNPKDKAKREEIYNRYDKLITPLLEQEKAGSVGVGGEKIKLDPDLANIDPTLIAARNGDVEAQKQFEEMGLDWKQTTTYRFVGQSEVDVLLANNKVESKRGMADNGIDVTSSPKVTTAATGEYRVTFKESFDKNNGLGKVRKKNEEDSNLERGRGYGINDVAKIERIDEKGNVIEVVYEQSLKETPKAESKPKAKPKKKRPARKNKVISKILDEFAVEPIDKVLQYFIGGGKINGDRKNPENAIQKIFGKKGGVKDLDKTYKSYFNLTRNNASTISQLAHSLWENNRDYSDYTSQDYEEAIIKVLSTHNGTNTMKEAFNDKFQINIPAEEMEMDIENEREELEYIKNQAEALREEYRDSYYEELDKLLAETPVLVFQLNGDQLQRIEEDIFITDETIELTDEQYKELQLIFIENENQNETNEREVDSSNEQVQGKSIGNKDDEIKSDLEAKVKEAKNAYQTAQGKLAKTKQAAEKAGQEQQNNIFGGKPADALLFGTDLRSLNEKVKERQAEVDKAKENLDKAQLALDNFVPSNQVQLNVEAPTESTIVKDPILKRLNKAFLKIGAEILDNAEQLAAKAASLVGDVRKNITAGFETRDGKPIGFTYDTDQVARERFDFSKLKQIGKGSDRTVFDLGNGRVLKVAHTSRGLEQNIYEGDYYLKKIIPEVFERGLNYVVVEETPRLKSSDIVPTYDVETNEENGTATAGEMIKELSLFNQSDFDKRNDKLQDVLTKYGFQDILSYEVLYGDFNAIRNWGYKNGIPMHLDGGTFGGVQMITKNKGKAPLSDPEFREIYNKSKQLKKQFGDTDKNTRFNITLPDGSQKQVKTIDVDVVNGFYSPLEKIISEVKQDKMPAKQWAEKFAKGEEAKWTGLQDWLAQQQGSVSKTDIQNFLKENRIEVVEVVKTDKTTKEQYNEDAIKKGNKVGLEVEFGSENEIQITLPGEGYLFSDDVDTKGHREFTSENYNVDISVLEVANELFNENKSKRYRSSNEDQVFNTKFSQYQLEGEKENYKEVLVTLPAKPLTFEEYKTESARGGVVFGSDARARESYNDYLKEPGKDVSKTENFKSSHFDESNILVHLRMNTRKDADGNKVLFLEEVQSDWGQKGKKEGFANIDKLPEGYRIDEPTKFSKWTVVEPSGVDGNIQSTTIGQGETKEEAVQRALDNLNRRKTVAAPFVMDTNAWTKLGLKYALKEAVKQGATKIAWTTGEQQNDRYDLSKQVSKIDVEHVEEAEGVFFVDIALTDGEVENLEVENGVIRNNPYKGQKLDAVLGKEYADKILSTPKGDSISLTGNDLKLGGKGMKGFYGSPSKLAIYAEPVFIDGEGWAVKTLKHEYDTLGGIGIVIYPTKELAQVQANKQSKSIAQKIATKDGFKENLGIVGNVAKSLFKQEPKTINLTLPPIKGFFEPKEPMIGSTQHSIDITPELAATVEQGQPLFHLNDKGEILGFTHNGKIYLNGEKITAKTTMEEAGHIWINWAKENRSDLYQQGLEKVQGSKYLIEVNNNPSYQKEALKQGEKGSDAYNAYMQEEALAKAIADNGAKFITETRKAGFREWVNAMWKEVAKAFGIQNLKPSEVKALTLEQFAKMAAADVFSNKETPSQEQAVDKADPQIAETIEATLKGEMNADDAAISLDEKGIEVTNEIYDKLREAEKQFQKEKSGIQVGDTVMVKGRNGNPDFEANFRGLDKNGKYIVYNTESGTTFSITKDEIITPASKKAELADLKEQLKKAKLTATKNEIQAKIDALEGSEPKAPKGPSDGLGSRTAANTNTITPTQNAERVSMKFHLELKKLIESIGVPIAERNLSKRFLGIFKHRSMNIRVQSLFGVATAAHETAHWVSKKFGIGEALREKSAVVAANPDAQLNKDIRKALTDIYTEFYPNAKKEHSLYLRVEEGIAVLMEHYLTDPTDITNRYGILVDNFIAPTGKYYHPKFTELLDKLNKFLAEYSALSPNEKIGSRIVSGEEVTKKNEGFTPKQAVIRGLVNAAEPLRRADNIADSGLTEESTEVAYIRWLSRAGIIAPWITGETHPITLDKNGNWKEVGASVKDYLELIKGREAEFSQYLVARRNLGDVNYLTEMENELAEILANIENEEDLTKEEVEEINELSARIEKQKQIIKNDNFDIQEVTETVRMFEDEFKAPVAIYDKLNNAVVDFAQKSGLISNEKAEAYKANTTYASFKRLILDDISAGGSAVGSDPKSQVGAFKTRTGTDLQIIDPVYSQIQFISETLNKGMQNMIWQKLAALSDTNVELARRFEKVPTIAIEDPITGAITYPQLNDPTKRVVLFNGKKSFYLAAPEYVALAETLTPKELETMAYILTKSAGIFSRLTTSANPLFPLVNIPIDTMSAWMNTKTGFIPGWSQMRAIPEMASYAKDKALLSAKNLANTAIDFLHNMIIIGDWFKGIKNIPIKNLSLEEQNLFAKYLALGGSTQTLSAYLDMSPEEMIKAITKKSLGKKVVQTIDDFTLGILEMPSNASEYMTRFAEFKRAKDQGYSDDVAMYMAAHVSVPFIQSGTYGGQVGKTAVKAVPYFHAGIQVISKFAQTAKNNPMRTATIGAALIAIKISQTLLTMALSDDDDKRMLAEQEPSELGKYIYVPNKLFGGKGFTRIRFGNEFGTISAPIEMMILQNKGLTKYNYKDYLDATTTAIPQQFNILKPVEWAWSFTPQIVRPTLEVGFNVRTYPNVRPIVPYGVSFKSPMNQYNQYTTETSKYLGKLAGVSPMKIDYFIKAQFGKVPDMLLRKTEEIVVGKENKSKSQIFLQEEQYVLAGKNYTDFYENNKYWDELYNDTKSIRKSGVDLNKEQLEAIENHKIFNNTETIIKKMRDKVNENIELPEYLKQSAFELLIDLNNSDKPYTFVDKYTKLKNNYLKAFPNN